MLLWAGFLFADVIWDLASYNATVEFSIGASDVAVLDFNGDGLKDVALGSSTADSGNGAVYIFLGPLEMWKNYSLSDADIVIKGSSGESLGFSLASADFDGDGKDDLAIGAPGASSGSGAVYYIKGSSALSGEVDVSSVADKTFVGFADGDMLGYALEVASTGSLYLVASAPGGDGVNDTVSGAGECYVFNPAQGSVNSLNDTVKIYGYQNGGAVGFSLTAGDVDGDSQDELIMGSPFFDNISIYGDFSRGAVYLVDVPGGDTVLNDTYIFSTGNMSDAFYGFSVSSGSIYGFSTDGVAVSSPAGGGSVFVYKGDGSLNAIFENDGVLSPASDADAFGSSVLVMDGGDKNAGKGVVVAGAPGYSGIGEAVVLPTYSVEKYEFRGKVSGSHTAFVLRSGNLFNGTEELFILSDGACYVVDLDIPSPPSLKSVRVVESGVEVEFESTSPIDETFDLYRNSTSVASLNSPVADNLSLTDSSPQEGWVSYRIKATNTDSGEASFSSSVDLFYLSPPGNLNVTCAGEGIANITWTDTSSMNEGFKVYRNGSLIATLPDGSSNYVDTLSSEGNYTYAVSSYNSSAGAESLKVSGNFVYIKSPSDLHSELLPEGVSLRWNRNSSIAQGERIYRKAGNETSFYAIANTSDTQLADNVPFEGNWSYRIYSYLGTAESCNCLSTSIFVVYAPANLTVSEYNSTHVILQWNNTSSIGDRFLVYESEDGSAFYNVDNTTSTSMILEKGFTGEGVRWYRVYTYDVDSGHSSTYVEATYVNMNPPSSLSAALSGRGVLLKWVDNSAIEDGYVIFRSRNTTDIGDHPVWTVPADSTSAVDVPSEGGWYYSVAAKRFSAHSNLTSPVYIFFPYPNIPQIVEAYSDASGEVILKWEDRSSLEDGYKILRAPVGGQWKSIAELPANSTEFRDSPGGGKWLYKVVAYNVYSSTVYESCSEQTEVDVIAYTQKGSSVVILGNLVHRGNAFKVKAYTRALARIVDVNGRTVFSFRVEPGEPVAVPTDTLAPGIYYVIFSEEGGKKYVRKVVVLR